MRIYMAPLEGVTGYLYRIAHEKIYGGIDKYFAPFISPSEKCPMTPKERKDLLPENNPGIHLVPQILTCSAEYFIDAVEALVPYGYREFNLNLGCPSGTVTAKRKGSGFLAEPEKLSDFLEEIYNYAAKHEVEFSIKTRLGYIVPEEFSGLLDIFNEYPVSELIVHPRIRKDFYKGEPRYEYYAYALEHAKMPLVYNGNIYTKSDYDQLGKRLQSHIGTDTAARTENSIDTVMLGRGLIGNPALAEELRTGKTSFDSNRFWALHDIVYQGYIDLMGSDTNVLYRMKDLWTFWRDSFDGIDRELKALMKAKKLTEYEQILQSIRS